MYPHWPKGDGRGRLRPALPRLATYRPIGSPLGRRTFAHWPHPTGCLSGQKGRRAFAYWPPTPPPPPLAREGTSKATPSPAPYWSQRGGHRREAFAPPLTGQTGRPTLATLPPFGRPTGAYGHRLPHWPPTGPLLAIRGGLPLAKGEAPTGHLLPLPHRPIEAFGREGQKSRPPPPDFRERRQRDGEGFLRAKGGWPPAPVRTGSP